MPRVEPFRALAYAPRLRAALERLVAPPYDVLSEEQRDRLAARHPHNVVHLDLPRAAAGEDPYEAAAGRLRRWLQEGVLARDEAPAFYACEQRYRSPAGGEATRRGFFARLLLEPFGSGSVIPHERTLDGPRADRLRLLAATRTHLSAVFMLHPDPGSEVARLVGEALGGDPFEQAVDDERTQIRVARLVDRERAALVADRLGRHWALIADGHHRYESALQYRDERRALGRRDAEHVLVFLCSLDDPGLAIFPIHRLVHSLPEFDPAAFRERLSRRFLLTARASPQDLRRELAARGGRGGAFGVVLPGGGLWLLERKPGEDLSGPEMAATPEPLRGLDVILLHRLVLEGILGITPEAQTRQANLVYLKDDLEVFARVAAGKAQIGFVLNPTRIEQVVEVTRAGFRLPQKSTYFYPKIPAGLVFDPLD